MKYGREMLLDLLSLIYRHSRPANFSAHRMFALFLSDINIGEE